MESINNMTSSVLILKGFHSMRDVSIEKIDGFIDRKRAVKYYVAFGVGKKFGSDTERLEMRIGIDRLELGTRARPLTGTVGTRLDEPRCSGGTVGMV